MENCNSNREIGKRKQGIVISLMLLLIIAFGNTISYAAEKELKHPIDIWLEHCIDSNPTTAGMNTCAVEAMHKWDKEMNIVYKELMSTLAVKQKVALKKSQVVWLKFRDEEFNFLDNFYGDFQGTMWSNILMEGKLSILKQRTLMLQVYLQNLKGTK